uniref:PABS domain-containing protein n=1 Tax=Musa acuminata subsp. malaccensis TaxID=214687 RepID=A0A804IW44_MUSAM
MPSERVGTSPARGRSSCPVLFLVAGESSIIAQPPTRRKFRRRCRRRRRTSRPFRSWPPSRACTTILWLWTRRLRGFCSSIPPVDNIHSMLNKEQLLTGSYWDDFASLPAIVPEGPIAILGLGGGTAAHIMLKLWPNLHLEGWEIDEILIDMAREYFGLSELEKCTSAGGSLSVHIGDAFSESVRVPGGFAGIIVDLFSDGKILPQLKEVTTWLDIERKLMPQGRIMVNCGGAHAEVSGSGDGTANMDGSWIQNSTIKALCQAFPGKLSWKRIAEKDSDNYLALTGPLPDLDAWSAAVPHQLSMNVKDWRTCKLAS